MGAEFAASQPSAASPAAANPGMVGSGTAATVPVSPP